MTIDLSKLPQELKSCSRWVLWRLEDVNDAEGKSRKRCKVPLKPTDPSKRASSTDASTWSSLEVALAHLAELSPAPGYENEPNNRGVGLTFGPPFLAVDLDKCYDEEHDIIAPWAEEILSQLPKTYTELSPSRTGFHLWYRCDKSSDLPPGHRTEKAEVYSAGRYFTMSGFHYEGTPLTVTDLSFEEAKKIFTLIKAQAPVKQAVKPSNVAFDSGKLVNLMTSTDHADMSAAVHSLITLLLRKHLGDRTAAEAEFKTSKIYLETHWKEKWARLGEGEMDKCEPIVREWIERDLQKRSKHAPSEQLSGRAVAVNFGTVKPEEVVWLWHERVPLGNVTIFAGDPGIGKSLLTLDMIGRGTIGADWLDGRKNEVGIFKSVVLAGEDDKATILIPRLQAIGANLNMVQSLEMIEMVNAEGEVKEIRTVNFEHDIMLLRGMLDADPEIKFVMIDPLSNYMGQKNLFRDQEVRSILMPLVKLAQDTNVAIVTVMHNSKQTGRSALAKVGAALGGVGVVRIAWSFIEDGESCLMLQMKKNLGKFTGVRYTTENAKVPINGKDTDQGRMKFIEESKATIESVMNSSEDVEEKRDKPAVQLLKRMVAPGASIDAKLILEEADKLGISEPALRRARAALGVTAVRVSSGNKGGGAWVWKRGEDDEPASDSSHPADDPANSLF